VQCRITTSATVCRGRDGRLAVAEARSARCAHHELTLPLHQSTTTSFARTWARVVPLTTVRNCPGELYTRPDFDFEQARIARMGHGGAMPHRARLLPYLATTNGQQFLAMFRGKNILSDDALRKMRLMTYSDTITEYRPTAYFVCT
jgi:hypothetical protein